MDNDARKIIHVEVVDKRDKEVELKSLRMEKVGLQRALAAVRSKANVTELVTDASRSIVSMMGSLICYLNTAGSQFQCPFV